MMIICKNLLLWMFVGCCASVLSVNAQTTAPKWHKQVYRVIDLAPNIDTIKNQPTNADTSDSGLMLLIANEVKAGKLRAFRPFDISFCHKLHREEIQEIFADYPDTDIVIDKNTNEEHRVIKHNMLNPGIIHKYQVQEDWNFDPDSGITEIQIAGLIPIRDVYGDDGVYRGSTGIFSVCYCDIQDLLKDYDQRHPNKTFVSFIWNDYFSADTQQTKTKNLNDSLMHKLAIRDVPLRPRQDTVTHHLKEANTDTTLVEIMMHQIEKRKLDAYQTNDFSLNKLISTREIKEKIRGPLDCTARIIDPNTNEEWPVDKNREPDVDYEVIRTFRLLEDWTFDRSTGKTKIQIKAVAPAREVVGDDGVYRGLVAPFGVKYGDVRNILAKYAQSHPDNNLAWNTWNNYFYSDVKPRPLE